MFEFIDYIFDDKPINKLVKIKTKKEIISAKRKCLILETHSDDSCISASGFLQKYSHKYDYYFALMVASDVKMNAINRLVTREERLEEYQNYVDYFKGTWVKNELIPFDADTKLNLIPTGELVKSIENALNYVKPDLMLVTGPSVHQDHTATYRAALSALRPCGTWCPPRVYVMENSTALRLDPQQVQLVPNVYCGLTEEQLDSKMRLFYDIFPSQRRPNSTLLSNEGIKQFAQYRGLECRRKYAEAFYQLQSVI